MNKRWYWGILFFILSVFILFSMLIYFRGDLIGIDVYIDRVTTILFLAIGCLLFIILYSTGLLGWKKLGEKDFLSFIKQENRSIKKESIKIEQKFFEQIKNYLYARYGLFWRRKTRKCLVVGTQADTERLLPNLTTERWQQSDATLMLYGGDLADEPNTTWLTAIKKSFGRIVWLRRKPLDAIIWLLPDNYLDLNRVSQAKLEQSLQRLKALNQAVGWQAPIYLVNTQTSVWSQAGRIEQSVGTLLPPLNITNLDMLDTLLDNLANQCCEKGMQQVTVDTRYAFLLQLSQNIVKQDKIRIKQWLAKWLSLPKVNAPRGLFFAPLTSHDEESRDVVYLPEHYLTMTPTWQTISQDAAKQRGRRMGVAWETLLCSVVLQPIEISQAKLNIGADGRSIVTLRLSFGELADFEQLDLSCLRLYFNADGPIASRLHYAFTHQVASMHIRYSTQAQNRLSFNGKITPVGFAAQDRLWLKPDNAFAGYQLLLEYFTFREKFMFVDLHGLDIKAVPEHCRYIDIELVLNESWPSDMPFDHHNIRLHCLPVINLFDLEADPIVVTQLESEYLLRPLLRQDGHVEIYSVEQVEAITRDGRFSYVPFTSFKHRGGMLRHDAPERYYHTRVRKGASGLHDTWLVLGGKVWDKEDSLTNETLSLRVTGTNGMLPRKALRNARINQICSAQAYVAQVKNLCALTLPCYPPTEDRFHWRVLSHLAPNYLSLMNAEVLRGTLALYDWTENELNRRRLEGIVDVHHREVKRIEKGLLQRGIEIEVTLNTHQFTGEGDVMLFGELLHQFFALYADINLFTKLVLVLLPTGKKVTWNSSKTSQPAL